MLTPLLLAATLITVTPLTITSLTRTVTVVVTGSHLWWRNRILSRISTTTAAIIPRGVSCKSRLFKKIYQNNLILCKITVILTITHFHNPNARGQKTILTILTRVSASTRGPKGRIHSQDGRPAPANQRTPAPAQFCFFCFFR